MIDFITIVCAVVALGFLILYNREKANYHFAISFLAYLTMNALFFTIIWLTAYGKESCWQLTFAVVVALAIICAFKGNVASIVRFIRRILCQKRI